MANQSTGVVSMDSENIQTSPMSTSTEFQRNGAGSNETMSASSTRPQPNDTFMVAPPVVDPNSEDVSNELDKVELLYSSSSTHESSTTSDCGINQRKRNNKKQKKDDDALFEQEIERLRLLFEDIQDVSNDTIKKEFVTELNQVRLEFCKKYYLKLTSG